MIQLNESIHINKPIQFVFDYVSDFGNIHLWDPGVVSSKRIQKLKPGIGSIFDLVLKFGPFRPQMRYETIDYQPTKKVVLEGKGDTFSAIDTIRFSKTETGTCIDYQAEIEFSGLGKRIEYFLIPVMKQTGKKAMNGLHSTLNKANHKMDKSWFESGANLFDYLSDHAILPGLLMFSRIGYEFSKRFWFDSDDNLFGKKIILTGGTSGIGKAAAFKLAEQNAFLTIIARNKKKAEDVVTQIIEKTKNSHIDYLLADLSLMKDIKHVAGQIKRKHKSIDVLINNAGALFNERNLTTEGFEQTFATDLLGIFYLTNLLEKQFSHAGNARIINVSSGGMYTQGIDLKDLQNESGVYSGTKAYARAKRGLVILTRLWAQKFRDSNIVVHAMHPGWVDTPGIENALPGFHTLINKILRTPDQGADTIVWLASSKAGGQSTGRFWLDRRPHETVIFPGTSETESEKNQLYNKLSTLVAAKENKMN